LKPIVSYSETQLLKMEARVWVRSNGVRSRQRNSENSLPRRLESYRQGAKYTVQYLVHKILTTEEVVHVTTISVSAFRNDLFNQLAAVKETCVPLTVTSKQGNFVVLSEDDWNDIEETLYVAAIPGVLDEVEAVRSGTAETVEWRK
jgi:prevent-host-death family protein